MYRQAAPPEPKAGPPPELLYVGRDRDHSNRSGVAVLQVFTLPTLVVPLVLRVAGPTAGLVAFTIGIGFVIWWLRRPDRGSRIVLRVENGELLVRPGKARGVAARFALDDLLNVSLDSKQIQRVHEGGSAIPGMRFIDSRVGPELTTARVILVGRDQPFVPVGSAYLAHMEATEWLGKIRVFLRKHGWVPEDERER